MATVQVRDLPDEVHAVYQRRALLAGMSLQEYLRMELTRGAQTRSPAELVSEAGERMRIEGPSGFARESSSSVVREDRDAH